MSKFRILELCKEKGITQKDLAEKIGMSPVGLAKAANGNPTVETLEKIAAGLSVSVTELFTPKSNTLVCPKCGTVLEVKERE
ncbi:helix-turn-helix domain-containing protein [uncultured Alistipes sp.]|uniref:helix-turn-helix domain-containing protein n=2 Tax=uncultured Alistipes sp. TaxID=538949 RepID=UPI0026102399|nr:helix-turn-helix transcriptional regulator [uncultured Alistipes sp.]